MSDKENSSDNFENDDIAKDQINAGDEAVEEVDLSNIDDDFDDDDEFYGGNDKSKGKWLNVLGVLCFLLAGLVGVWQFWLSGVDKYEEKNKTVTPVTSIAQAPVAAPLPVVAIEEEAVVTDESVIIQTMDALPEGLPEVSVEMSEDVISDAELLETVEQTGDVILPLADEAMSAVDGADNAVENIVQAVDEISQDNVDPVINTMMPEADMNIEEIEDFLVAETSDLVEEPVVENLIPENEVLEAMASDAVEEELSIVDEVVSEKIDPDTSDIIEEIVADAPALPEPKAEELAPIIQEEFVEETPTIVPQSVEYGSLTPAQILERAVVVRPRPKKLVVVKKNSSSTSSRSILVAADRSLKQGSLADALSLYDDVLSKNSSDISALMGKALTLQKLNHKGEAIAAYKKVLDIDPNNLNAMTNYLGLIKNNDPMTSINQLKGMEVKNPKSAAIAGTLGTLYGQMQDVSNAARYYNKAQALDAKNPVYPYNLAILSDRMGSKAKALEHYQKTLQLVLRYGGQGVVSEQVVARRITELTSTR